MKVNGKKKRITFFLSSLFVFFVSQLVAQEKMASVIPPSPNAASLGKFVEQPVSLYNGTPEIVIPLYTVEVGNLKLPISLSYHAGGIKVSENASNIGLGWALNAGGVITRSVQGLNDERGWFIGQKVPPPVSPSCITATSSFSLATALELIDNGTYDTEPDIFYYNFNGLSGKFVFDQNGVIQTVPRNKLKIEQFNSLASWKVTTEDGTIYTFAQREFTSNSGSYTFNTSTYPSAWYLTEISSPSSTQKITFTYTNPIYCYSEHIAEKNEEGGNGPSTVENSACVTAAELSEIQFPSGKIQFTEGNYRYDISGSKVMDRITIRSNDAVIKSFKLNHKYLGVTGMIDDDGLANATSPEDANKRLFLSDVVQYGMDNIQHNPPYVFDYEPGALPNRLTTKAMDYWGYYNGHTENTTSIPPHFSAFFNAPISGGDRTPVEQYAKIGNLIKITYPTGGYSQYDYEQNMAAHAAIPTNNIPITANFLMGECHISGSSQFTIDDNVTGTATLQLSLSGQLNNYTLTNCAGATGPLPVSNDANTFIYFNIVNITDPLHPVTVVDHDNRFLIPRPSASSGSITLSNGIYRIIAVRGTGTTALTESDANFHFPVSLNIVGNYFRDEFKIGGLRIKKFTDYDPFTNKSIIKTYDYTDQGVSSGKTSGVFKYNHPGSQLEGSCFMPEVWTSYSQAPLSLQQSAPVGYSKVTVYNEEVQGSISSSGKTEYYFTNPVDVYAIPVMFDYGANSPSQLCYRENNAPDFNAWPYAAGISSDWNRGFLTRQIDYKTNSSSTDYVKVKEIVNTYKDDYLGPADVRGNNNTTDIKAMRLGILHSPCTSDFGNVIWKVYTQYYFIPVRFQELIKTEEYNYDPTGANPLVQTQDFAYENLVHMQLTKKIAHKSDGNTIATQYLYPLDYTDATGVIADMKSANIINQPIESVSYLTKAATGEISVVNGKLTTYKTAPNLGLPGSIKALKIAAPIPLAQFRFSNQSTGGILPQPGITAVFSNDPIYPTTSDLILSYDNNGKIISSFKENDVKKAYIWDYANTYPICEVLNANSGDIAYTGFESDGTGSWTLSPGFATSNGSPITGSKYGSGTLSKTVTTGNYVVTLWASGAANVNGASGTVIATSKKDPSWKCYTWNLSNVSSVQVNITNADEIRLYPASAQMTTYTYTPLIGITSQCDVNNRILYYEYDGLSRLQVIKDQDGNVTKTFDYHYVGQ